MCSRVKATTCEQKMSVLPPSCTNISRLFSHVGADFTGVLIVKWVGHRSLKYNKSYGAVFVCMVTKAVHLELASDLPTESFFSSGREVHSKTWLP